MGKYFSLRWYGRWIKVFIIRRGWIISPSLYLYDMGIDTKKVAADVSAEGDITWNVTVNILGIANYAEDVYRDVPLSEYPDAVTFYSAVKNLDLALGDLWVSVIRAMKLDKVVVWLTNYASSL